MYTWSLSGIDNASEYVSLSASTGDSITVSAKQAFGTPITLMCTATYSNIEYSSATCRLDYRKRLETMSVNGKIGDVDMGQHASGFIDAVRNVTLNFAPVYSEYTVEDNYNISLEFSFGGKSFFTTKNLTLDYVEIYTRYAWRNNGYTESRMQEAVAKMRTDSNDEIYVVGGFMGMCPEITVMYTFTRNGGYIGFANFTKITSPESWKTSSASLSMSADSIVL